MFARWVFLVLRCQRFKSIMIDQNGRVRVFKTNIDHAARAANRLNRADAARRQPTDWPQCADAIAGAKVV